MTHVLISKFLGGGPVTANVRRRAWRTEKSCSAVLETLIIWNCFHEYTT